MVNDSLFVLALRSSSGRKTFIEPNNLAGTLKINIVFNFKSNHLMTLSHFAFKNMEVWPVQRCSWFPSSLKGNVHNVSSP